jgi:hypothetical protein
MVTVVMGCTWGTLNGPGDAISSTPQGNVLVTMINADATEVYFTMEKVYDGAWKVYKDATGSASFSMIKAFFNVIDNVPFLILKSMIDPISPRTYYVSLTEDGKIESERFALWGEPLTDPSPMSLAKRFRLVERGGNIPDALLEGAAGVSAVFNLLHAYLQDVRAGMLSASDYVIPGIVLGDWVDLDHLQVAGYNGAGGFAVSNAEVPGHGTLLRLLVVGNNSFHSGRGSYTVTANNATPHLVFQFQNLFDARRMHGGNTKRYVDCDIRTYLTKNYINGLRDAGLPVDYLFAPVRYVTNGGQNGVEAIQDKVWLPTMRELFWNDSWALGVGHFYPVETAANQARLEYYTNNETRKKGKLDGGNERIWVASAYNNPGAVAGNVGFCLFNSTTGSIENAGNNASDGSGAPADPIRVCPAFCVW